MTSEYLNRPLRSLSEAKRDRAVAWFTQRRGRLERDIEELNFEIKRLDPHDNTNICFGIRDDLVVELGVVNVALEVLDV